MSTNVSGEKVGEIFAEIGLKFDKIDSDFKKVEDHGKKTAEKLESSFKQTRLDIDSRLATMKLSEVKKYYDALKIQMEQKVKFNADSASLEKTAIAMDAARARMKELGNESEKTNNKIVTNLKSIAGALGITFGGYALFNFTKQAVIASAELEVLRSNFKGTAADIELFKRATAGTVTEANLIKLSNQATDLGLSLEQQAIFFAVAEDAADKYGGGVEEGMSKVIMATEGNAKALKALGIQKKVFEEIVKDLTQEFAKQGKELDSESLKQITIQALLKATGLTIEDVNNKLKDSKDKVESVGTAWENLKATSGLQTILIEAIGLFQTLFEWADKAGNAIDKALNLKGVFGPGEGVKEPREEQQGRQDLEKALSARRYIGEGGGIKEFTTQWTSAGKSVEEIKKHIESLLILQNALIPGSKEYTANLEEVAALTKLISPKEIVGELFGAFDKQKTDLAEVNKLLENKNWTEAKRNILLEKQAQLQAEIYKYEHPNTAVGKIDKNRLPYKSGKVGVSTLGDSASNDGSPFDKTIANIKNELDDATRANEEFAQSMSSAFAQGIMFGENFGDVLENIAEQLAGMVIQAAFFASIMSIINPSNPLGFLGFFGKALGFAHSGGEFVGTSSGVMKMAGGGSFMVPTGYPNDSFPLMVETGERVTVTPAGQVNQASSFSFNESNIVNEIKILNNKIDALAKRPLVSKTYLDGKQIATSTTKYQNGFERGNIHY